MVITVDDKKALIIQILDEEYGIDIEEIANNKGGLKRFIKLVQALLV